MTLTCLIEANVPGIPADTLEREFIARRLRCHFVKFMPGESYPRDLAGAESVGHCAHAIFFGSPTTMRHIQSARDWIPGGWSTFKNFACSSYYAYFGLYMTNQHCVFLPVAEAIRRASWISEQFAVEGEIFVRPDAANKRLPGRVIETDDLRLSLQPYAFNPTNLVLVGKPIRIAREYRVFVAHSEIVTCSQYLAFGELAESPNVPFAVTDFVREVLRTIDYRPDPLFVIDVAEVDGQLSVLELNPYSCANPYAGDVAKIVDAAVKQALNCW